MDRNFNSLMTVMKRPSAFLPLAMSLIALAMVLIDVAIYGRGPAGDNEFVEHLWQIFMVGQAPIVLFFAIKWLPRAPRQTGYVLAEQAVAALASFAAVYFLGLG